VSRTTVALHLRVIVAFRTYREPVKKVLEQRNLVLALYMWRRDENREFVGDVYILTTKKYTCLPIY
jgi:hypothetical protein